MRAGSRSGATRWIAGVAAMATLAVGAVSTLAAEEIPRPRGHVNDFAGVLAPEAAQRLEDRLIALERETGAEVAVATVDRVPDGDVDGAAVRWFQAWGVGKRGRDNGVLILAAIGDRKVRIEVGYGLEPVLPDAAAGRIIREQMAPAFRAGDFGAGLTAAAEAVEARIRAAAAGEPAPVSEPGPSAFEVAFLLLVVFVVFGIPLIGWWLHPERLYGRGRRLGRANSWDEPSRYWGGDLGGFGGGGGGGGFGGFGGGSSGGGGASGSW